MSTRPTYPRETEFFVYSPQTPGKSVRFPFQLNTIPLAIISGLTQNPFLCRCDWKVALNPDLSGQEDWKNGRVEACSPSFLFLPSFQLLFLPSKTRRLSGRCVSPISNRYFAHLKLKSTAGLHGIGQSLPICNQNPPFQDSFKDKLFKVHE